MPPSKLSKVTEDSDMMSENAALSISIALGDHNFPDLAQFALGIRKISKKLSRLIVLNNG